MRILIFDVDGVLFDSTHRFRKDENGKIDLKYWVENEFRHEEDKLLPHVDIYKKAIASPNIRVVVATARDMETFNQKQHFIDKLGRPDAIISRQGRGDSRKGAELKISGINGFLEKIGGTYELEIYEDNIEYLKTMCDYYNCLGYYVPSKQGV